jgi:hypothetical protein
VSKDSLALVPHQEQILQQACIWAFQYDLKLNMELYTVLHNNIVVAGLCACQGHSILMQVYVYYENTQGRHGNLPLQYGG